MRLSRTLAVCLGSTALWVACVGAACSKTEHAQGTTTAGGSAAVGPATSDTATTASSSHASSVVSSAAGAGGAGGAGGSTPNGAGGAGGAAAPPCVGQPGTFYAQSAFYYGSAGPTPMCTYANDVILVVNTADA